MRCGTAAAEAVKDRLPAGTRSAMDGSSTFMAGTKIGVMCETAHSPTVKGATDNEGEVRDKICKVRYRGGGSDLSVRYAARDGLEPECHVEELCVRARGGGGAESVYDAGANSRDRDEEGGKGLNYAGGNVRL